MRWVNTRVQGKWLHRRGTSGRLLTTYLHRYNGKERTGTYHKHPWWLAFGIVLSGEIWETVGRRPYIKRRRFSVQFYTRETEHWIGKAHGLTLFIGLGRTQRRIPRTAEVEMPEGWCHWSEVESRP